MTLTNSAPNEKLTLAMVKESMLNEEAKRRERGLTNASSQSEALILESRGRSQSRKPHSSDRSESRSKSRGKYKLRKEFICHYCGKSGHMKRYCRFLKREQSRGRNEDKGKDSDKETAAIVYEDVRITYDENYVNLVCDASTWIMDSGVSCHVTPKREISNSIRSEKFTLWSDMT